MACDSTNQAAHYPSKFVAHSLTSLFSQKQLGKPMGQTSREAFDSQCKKASALLGTTAETSQMFQPTPSTFKIDFSIFSYTSSSSYVT
jgi:hypothetical protein